MWPNTTLLLVWPRDTKRLHTPKASGAVPGIEWMFVMSTSLITITSGNKREKRVIPGRVGLRKVTS